jgi:putative holliday junction resolvase
MQQQPPPQPPVRPRPLLGVDPGERRVGIALSDELGLFAHPRPALTVTSTLEAVDAIILLCAAEDVGEVVVGLPIAMSGRDTAQTLAARAFAAALRARLKLRVTEWDERLSTVEASRSVKGAASRRSGALDSAAAAVVLQAVIDSRRPAVPR